LALSDGTTRTVDDISRNQFILVGIGVDVERLRKLLAHPLAKQQRWSAIAIIQMR